MGAVWGLPGVVWGCLGQFKAAGTFLQLSVVYGAVWACLETFGVPGNAIAVWSSPGPSGAAQVLFGAVCSCMGLCIGLRLVLRLVLGLVLGLVLAGAGWC